jgi:uncharacterized protein (TIGR02147 family)
MSYNYAVQLLKDELARRVEQNSRYSLRAFAKLLKVHPSALSRILSEKQPLSVKTAAAIVKQLRMNPDKKRLFMISVIEEKRRYEISKVNDAFDDTALNLGKSKLDSETFAEVFNLEAHAVLQLTESSEFKADPAWISIQLGINETKVKSILDALLRCGQLHRTDGTLKIREANFSSVDPETTTESRRKHQRDILEKALESLENQPMEERAHYGLTICSDKKKVAEAKELIMQFLESMNDFMSAGNRTEVFQIAVQLFPLRFHEPKDEKATFPVNISF